MEVAGSTSKFVACLPYCFGCPGSRTCQRFGASFHGMPDVGSKLTVRQEGELVRARIEFNSSSPIRRAILWRKRSSFG